MSEVMKWVNARGLDVFFSPKKKKDSLRRRDYLILHQRRVSIRKGFLGRRSNTVSRPIGGKREGRRNWGKKGLSFPKANNFGESAGPSGGNSGSI